MIIQQRYVIDTNALISFYGEVFKSAEGYEGSPRLSNKVLNIISESINSSWTNLRLSIPSIVFIEIYEKWLRSEEFCARFFYEVFIPIQQSENVEIRPTDLEVLEHLLSIDESLTTNDLHDRLVLASAIALECPLITTDEKIVEYIDKTQILPTVLN